jgi:hypothetical protein
MPMKRHPRRAIRERWTSRRGANDGARAEKTTRRAAAKAQHREHKTLKEGSHHIDSGSGF